MIAAAVSPPMLPPHPRFSQQQLPHPMMMPSSHTTTAAPTTMTTTTQQRQHNDWQVADAHHLGHNKLHHRYRHLLILGTTAISLLAMMAVPSSTPNSISTRPSLFSTLPSLSTGYTQYLRSIVLETNAIIVFFCVVSWNYRHAEGAGWEKWAEWAGSSIWMRVGDLFYHCVCTALPKCQSHAPPPLLQSMPNHCTINKPKMVSVCLNVPIFYFLLQNWC